MGISNTLSIGKRGAGKNPDLPPLISKQTHTTSRFMLSSLRHLSGNTRHPNSEGGRTCLPQVRSACHASYAKLSERLGWNTPTSQQPRRCYHNRRLPNFGHKRGPAPGFAPLLLDEIRREGSPEANEQRFRYENVRNREFKHTTIRYGMSSRARPLSPACSYWEFSKGTHFNWTIEWKLWMSKTPPS